MPVGFAIMVRGGLICSIACLRILIGVTSLLEFGAALSYDALFLFDVDESLLFLEKSLLSASLFSLSFIEGAADLCD